MFLADYDKSRITIYRMSAMKIIVIHLYHDNCNIDNRDNTNYHIQIKQGTL